MFRHSQQRHWLYALTAMVLLLQSFAVWHSAEHPFHTADIHCERFNAINHLPVADITPELVVSFQTAPVEFSQSSYVSQLVNRLDKLQAIRAPPLFS